MHYCTLPLGHPENIDHQEVVIMNWKKNKETHIKVPSLCYCEECENIRIRQESAGLL